jgi:hypothetical protein
LGKSEQFIGYLDILLDNQLPVEVLMEHHLRGKTSKYPLIVISEFDYIDPDLLIELNEYVQNDGNLLLIGTETTSLFAEDLGIESSKIKSVTNSTIFAGESGIKSTEINKEIYTFISADNRRGSVLTPIFSDELTPDT